MHRTTHVRPPVSVAVSVALGTVGLLLSAPTLLVAQPHAGHEEMQRRHRSSSAYIAALDNPERDAYQKPDEVIEALQLQPGERIADIGAGSGYFSVRLAEAVGDTGQVWAVDINPDMVLHMNRRLRDAGITNVRTVLAAPDDPLLPDASVDRFFICNVWHHVEDQAGYLALMRRMLRPGGQVVMVDFQKRDLPVGPRVGMKIAKADLLAQMESNDFQLAEEHDFLPYQYFLVFTVQ